MSRFDRIFRAPKISLPQLAAATVLATALIPFAQAAIEPSRNIVLVAERSNGDYLRHVEAPTDDPTINERVFNKGMSAELRARYSAIYDTYEKNKNYNVGGLENELRYNDANKSLGTWTMQRMLDEQVRTPVRRYVWHEVRDTLRHHDDNRPAGASGASAAAAEGKIATAALPQGPAGKAEPSKSLSLREMYSAVENFYNNGLWLNTETLMRFQYDVPGGTMNLAFTGGLIDTSLDYYVVPLAFSGSGGFGGNMANPERAALSMNRGFGDLGVSTNMHYGLMSRSLSYGMNKTLIGPLSAGVSQAHSLSDSSHDETTYRLSFGLVF